MQKCRSKNFIQNIFLAFASLFFMYIFLEIVFYIIKPDISYKYMPQKIEESFFETSSNAEFTLKRGYKGRFLMSEASFDSIVKTNSLGWRDTEPDKRSKILVFGDSYVFGFGLNNGETIPDYLESISLNKINFVNLGYTAGRSPDSYAIYLKYNSLLHDEYVIILICSNDIEDISLNYYLNENHQKTPFESGECFKVQSKTAIIRDGRLFADKTFINTHFPIWLIHLMKRSYFIGLLRDRLPSLKNKLTKELFVVKRSDNYANALDRDSLRVLFQSLNAIHKLSKGLIVFAIGCDDNDPIPLFQEIEMYCKDNDIKYYLIPKLDRSCYWGRDAHYNKKGSLWVSKFIYERLPKSWINGN